MNKHQEILKEINEKLINNIGIDWFGFNSIVYESNGSNDFFLFRENNQYQKKDIIYLVYDQVTFSNGLKSLFIDENHIQSWVLFNNISDILYEIIEKVDNISTILYKKNLLGELGKTVLNIPNYDKSQHWMVKKKENLILYQTNKIQVENIKKTAENIFKQLTQYHLPFFERVSSLQYVNDEIIDKVPKEEYGNYISGRYMNVKVLIIMKLCNNSRYKEYRDWAIGAYRKGVEINADRYKEDYEIVLKTVEYLDSGKYLEVIQKVGLS